MSPKRISHLPHACTRCRVRLLLLPTDAQGVQYYDCSAEFRQYWLHTKLGELDTLSRTRRTPCRPSPRTRAPQVRESHGLTRRSQHAPRDAVWRQAPAASTLHCARLCHDVQHGGNCRSITVWTAC